MTYRSESDALRARADSLEQELQRQKAEVAEGRAAKAQAKALEQELEAARAKLAKFEHRHEPKPRTSSFRAPALVLGIVSLMAAGAQAYFFLRAPVERPAKAVAATARMPETSLPKPVAAPGGYGAHAPTISSVRWVGLPRMSVAPSGELNPRAIRRVLRHEVRHVKRCYESDGSRPLGHEGRLHFEWTIGSDGAVKAAKVTSTTVDRALESCVLARLRTWRFPRPTQDVVVSCPVVLRTVAQVGR